MRVNEVAVATYTGTGNRSVDVTMPVGGRLQIRHRTPIGVNASTVSAIQLLTSGEELKPYADSTGWTF